MRDDIVPPSDFGFIFEVRIPTLIRPLDASRSEEIVREIKESLFASQVVQPQHGQFEFGMAGISVQLVIVGSEMLDEAVYILFPLAIKASLYAQLPAQ